MTTWLKNLNPQQRQAVEITNQPLRVVAGAGAGKTTVITTKIAHLILTQRIPSFKILALTFTNKAAQEMKQRVQKLLHDPTANPWISTFHAFCARVLREDYAFVGLEKNFDIIDASDQKTIIKQLVKQDSDIAEGTKTDFTNKALSEIRHWKNELLDPQIVLDQNFAPETLLFAKLYQNYQTYLRKENLVDFDDLQILVYQLWTQNQEILRKWADRFEYILVDEFQDTNDLQFNLIKLLTIQEAHLTVVGDPDQTIYSWRGAKIRLINDFLELFPNAESVILAENYRSTQPILKLSNQLIAKNKDRVYKELFTHKINGLQPEVCEYRTRGEEAQAVVQKIKTLVQQKKYTYQDFFILYRSNFLSRNLEEALNQEKIPYQLIGAIKFRERKVIKDALAFLKAVVIHDQLSTERILHLTPKVGEITLQKLIALATAKNLTLYQLLTSGEDFVAQVSKYLAPLRQTLLKAETMVVNNAQVTEIMAYLLKTSGYWEQACLLDGPDHDNQNNLETFLDQLRLFDQNFQAENYQESQPALAFLQEEALAGDVDEKKEVNKVTLLTIHSAKGLENKVVFIIGLNEAVFPAQLSMTSRKQLEEERRIFYVGMTRAMERLTISYVSGDYTMINGRFQLLQPSRFICDLDEQLYSGQKNIFFHPDQGSSNAIDLSPTSAAQPSSPGTFKTHDVVKHMLFGEGIIIKEYSDEYQIAFTNPKIGIQSLPKGSPLLQKK